MSNETGYQSDFTLEKKVS